MTGVDLTKLDDARARLPATGHIEGSQRIPVAIQASAGHLEAVRHAVEESGGAVRHLLRPLNTVAAWLPVSMVQPLASLDSVEAIEVDPVMHVA